MLGHPKRVIRTVVYRKNHRAGSKLLLDNGIKDVNKDVFIARHHLYPVVAQLVARLLLEQDVLGSNPGLLDQEGK